MASRHGGLQFMRASSSSKGVPEGDDIRTKAHDALRNTFGFESFRGRQEEAVMGILSGKDVFVLMPTGAGKSLCYGLPPLVKPGVAVVVSPLIALMEDQVKSFRSKGLRAELLASTQPAAERSRVMADLHARRPSTQLLFVTPELLGTEGGLQTLQWLYSAGNLLLVAVDEAHCISSWGHDFRSAYRKLWVLRQELQRVPIMALTATASARVQDDIVQQLRLSPSCLRLVSTFNRPNISYQVRYVGGTPKLSGMGFIEDSMADLVEVLERERSSSPDGSTPYCIIYTHKRDTADGVAFQLGRRGLKCSVYHAGLPDKERSRVLAEWSRGEAPIIAATVAFGMGVDKADVRLVVHLNLPKSIEGFYQESGRAGRDGNPAKSLVYYSSEDRRCMEFLLDPSKEKKRQRWQQQQGRGQAGGDLDRPSQLQQFGQVVSYCIKPGGCRRAFTLAHFGERSLPARPERGCCDYCTDPKGVAAAIAMVETAGLQQRQRLLGGATLDYSGTGAGGARGGGALEFELDRPSEGLDYDVDRPTSFFDDEDGIEASDGEGEGGEREAQEALKRARKGAGPRDAHRAQHVLDALEAAEQRYERQEAAAGAGQGTKSRLLAKLEGSRGEGGAGSAGPGHGSGNSGVPETLRLNVRTHLAKALAGNASLAAALSAMAGGGRPASEAAAYALERLCLQGASKPVYQSKASNLLSQLKRAKQASDVPQLATLLAGCLPTAGAVVAASAAAVVAPAAPGAGNAGQDWGPSSREGGAQVANPDPGVPQEEEEEQQQQQGRGGGGWHQELISAELLSQLVQQAQQAAAGAAEGNEDGQGAATPAAAAHAVAALRQLAAAKISGGLLMQTGAGRAVRALRKHAHPQVAAAAGEVFGLWKAAFVAGNLGS